MHHSWLRALHAVDSSSGAAAPSYSSDSAQRRRKFTTPKASDCCSNSSTTGGNAPQQREVSVHFKSGSTDGVYTTARPGDNLWEVCGVLPSVHIRQPSSSTDQES